MISRVYVFHAGLATTCSARGGEDGTHVLLTFKGKEKACVLDAGMRRVCWVEEKTEGAVGCVITRCIIPGHAKANHGRVT